MYHNYIKNLCSQPPENEMNAMSLSGNDKPWQVCQNLMFYLEIGRTSSQDL